MERMKEGGYNEELGERRRKREESVSALRRW
jgi:hypothetical protein